MNHANFKTGFFFFFHLSSRLKSALSSNEGKESGPRSSVSSRISLEFQSPTLGAAFFSLAGSVADAGLSIRAAHEVGKEGGSITTYYSPNLTGRTESQPQGRQQAEDVRDLT